jgi:flagellar motility protein MotE (MotC chaperone)
VTAPNRVFLARLAGIPVLDPNGDPVGKVRDVVAALRVGGQPPRVLGLVIEVLGRRRVFLPMTRVTSVDVGQVITTGLLNLRRFEQRPTETLVLGEMLDRRVTLLEDVSPVIVSDVGMEQTRTRDWVIHKIFVTRPGRGLRRRGESFTVEWSAVSDFALREDGQGTANLLATFEALHPADLASILHELSAKRRGEVAAALDDDRLADVLEELPEDDQVEILGKLADERAADVLEAMAPDDAADLLAELPAATAARLLDLMEPGDAAPLRRLMTYSEDTAGGLMTTAPVILPPTATVAEALARVREPELSAATAVLVFVCRSPLETPTGQFLGTVHIQRLLREPPSTLVSGILDGELEPLRPDASLRTVTSYLATYNLIAVPIVDENDSLLGVVTVDDVLDHLLPDDWRAGAQSSAAVQGTPAGEAVPHGH